MKESKSKVYESLVEFLKPNKWKIIFTIILMLIFFFLLLIGHEQIIILFYLPLIISGPFNIYPSGGFDIFITPTILSIIIALLIYTIQIYLISCLLILLYNKIRRLNYRTNVKNK
ncbi:MAG: hypothetical protein AABX33_02315 [Nanoarchaeota archaeon]